jgi:tetratricopeptide (TPR) repeat protein
MLDAGSNKTSGNKHPASSIQHPASSIDTAPIAQLSTLPDFNTKDYFRTIAQLGIQAAEALDHAHQNGILHLDIKPANLLVECSDAGVAPSSPRRVFDIQHRASSIQHLKLWITDFGLARMETDAGMTMTGDILGTLRYMSPEQALAKRVVVDHRSDIYSLGVTLYELLTLQPAFTGEDRQELLRQIAFEEPQKPQQINARIPFDLETILLKAIEKNPADRYATAQRLADDLRAFLHNLPIKAKPPSVRQRSVKWARRHRPLVVSSAVSLVALVLISLAVLASSNVVITQERNEKVAALTRAERNYRRALGAVDRLLSRVGNQTLAEVPQLDQLRKEILEDTLSFYDDFLAENPGDHQVQFDTAKTYTRVGEMYHDFRKFSEATKCREQAISILETLHGLEPVNPSYRYELAIALYQRSWLTHERADAHRAVELLQELVTEFPKNSSYREELAECLLHYTASLFFAFEPVSNIEPVVQQLVQVTRPVDVNERFKAGALCHLARLNACEGHLDDAERSFSGAIEAHRAGISRQPSNGRAREDFIDTCILFGEFLEQSGKLQQAEAFYREAQNTAGGLRRDFPGMKNLPHAVGRSVEGLVRVLRAQGRADELANFLLSMPAVDAETLHARANAYIQLKQYDKALADYEHAVRLTPDDPWLFHDRGVAYHHLGRYADAHADYQRALAATWYGWRANNTFAWLLATAPDAKLRDGKRAVELAIKACESTSYRHDYFLDTLAAAYAEAGNFKVAQKWSNAAIDLAANKGAREEWTMHLQSFQIGQPWRDTLSTAIPRPKP